MSFFFLSPKYLFPNYLEQGYPSAVGMGMSHVSFILDRIFQSSDSLQRVYFTVLGKGLKTLFQL